MKRLQLKLLFQSTLYSEKDKLTSISYDYDTYSISYKIYMQVKVTIVKNTMSSALNFETTCILLIR